MRRHRARGSGRIDQPAGRHVDRARQPGNTARVDATADALYDNPGRSADDPDQGAR